MRFPSVFSQELRVGLCPDRLVIQHRRRGKATFSSRMTADPLAELQTVLDTPDFLRARCTVVLSSRYVRYAVLPWDASLSSEDEWQSYGGLHLNRVYGSVASEWNVSLSRLHATQSRVACAVDRGLRDFLREVHARRGRSRLVSAEPYLISAFNLRRKLFKPHPAWFVLQEPRCLTLGLIHQGQWKSLRRRAYEERWQETLPFLIERQSTADALPACERVLLWAEDQEGGIPQQLGRYAISDVTPAASSSDRQFSMARCR